MTKWESLMKIPQSISCYARKDFVEYVIQDYVKPMGGCDLTPKRGYARKIARSSAWCRRIKEITLIISAKITDVWCHRWFHQCHNKTWGNKLAASKLVNFRESSVSVFILPVESINVSRNLLRIRIPVIGKIIISWRTTFRLTYCFSMSGIPADSFKKSTNYCNNQKI